MHSQLLTVALVTLFSVSALAVPHGHSLMERRGRPDNHTLNRERADAVKSAFTFAWDGYYKYAFPHDELHPVSNSYSDSRYACMTILVAKGVADVTAETAGVLQLWMLSPLRS